MLIVLLSVGVLSAWAGDVVKYTAAYYNAYSHKYLGDEIKLFVSSVTSASLLG